MSSPKKQSELAYSSVFQNTFVPIWIENIAPLYQEFSKLKKSGVKNFRVFLAENPEEILNLSKKIEILDINQAAMSLYGAQNPQELLGSLYQVMGTIDPTQFASALVAFWNQDEVLNIETTHCTLKNSHIRVLISTRIPRFDSTDLVIPVTITNMTDLREEQNAVYLALEEKTRLADMLLEALEEIKTLRGIIPICASCKKVRDDDGYWSQIEQYISDRTEAMFTHGICPDCSQRLYPQEEN